MGERKRANRAPAPTAQTSTDPIRNFSLSVDERIRALTIGVPSWAARKRRIEDEEQRMIGELVDLHDDLRDKGRDPAAIDLAMRSAAAAFDLTKLNALVASHNRYYPIEANLPLDRKTGAYLVYGRPWRPETLFTPARLLAGARTELGDTEPLEAD